jgi:hypothetical protein
MKQDDPKVGGWTLKKEVSLGDLIAFTSAALAVIYAYSTLDSRVKILEENKAIQQRNDQRQDDESIRYQARIDATLSQINGKLDRLVERR